MGQEIDKSITDFEDTLQILIEEETRIDNERELQGGLLAKAKAARDTANESGNKVDWENSMDEIAVANKNLHNLDDAGVKLEAGISKMQREWGPIKSLFVPIQNGLEHEGEVVRNKIQENEAKKGNFMASVNILVQLAERLRNKKRSK